MTEHTSKSKVEIIRELLDLNPDSRHYFFTKADERWLGWLWKNGFLDVIKKEAEDPPRITYPMPELQYLGRMAAKDPKTVVDIILDTPISRKMFNPEVIDQFLRICSDLPAEQLVRVIPKIRDDVWTQLLSPFDSWGFKYKEMFQTLAAAKEYKSIIMVAEAVLAIRSKTEIKRSGRAHSSENPFYIGDLSYTKVFEHLVAVDDAYVEEALKLTTQVLSNIVGLGDARESGRVFPMHNMHYVRDFFALKRSDKKRLLDEDNVRELVATIKELTERLFEHRRGQPESVRETYDSYFAALPDTWMTWRLRLFVLSLYPSIWPEKLQHSFARLFEVMDEGKRYYEIEGGTEYKKALATSFASLESSFQREYVRKVFQCFGIKLGDEDQERSRKRDGWEILSSICSHLTDAEKEECERNFGRACDPNFEPQPLLGEVEGGFIQARGPLSPEELSNLPIPHIVDRLKGEWSPEGLRSTEESQDWLHPLNAEGTGDMLRSDIASRLPEYVRHAALFFERNTLDEHYTYSFLRGVEEAIHGKRELARGVQWDALIDMLISIMNTGKEQPFNPESKARDTFSELIVSWNGVHSAMSELIHELLLEDEGATCINFQSCRKQLLDLLEYLLDHPDPQPKDEEPGTAVITTKSPTDEEALVTDPFTLAINTVRGKAFRAYILFVYHDGKQFSQDDEVKIAADSKEVYERVLSRENTRAIMFMYGYYLRSFYYRDIDWIRGLLPQIFPAEEDEKYLYVAAWEGYLVNNLYGEMFCDPAFQNLYERGLGLSNDVDPHRKFFRDLDEGIAVHFALAFVVYREQFGFEHPLFQAFWKDRVERQAEFISFIGRMFLSGNNPQVNKLLEEHPEEIRARLAKLWQWVLDNHSDTRLFSSFGYWIDLEKEVFEPGWLAQKVMETLTKTKGVITWDSGLSKSVAGLAKNAPAKVLEIARLYLLEGKIRSGKAHMPHIYREEWFEALKVLYSKPETQGGVRALVDNLIREGGSLFWDLKDVFASPDPEQDTPL